MTITKTLGGDRLGSGNKNKLSLHNYERSTHDLGYIWRSTMATGTLVPFLKQVALPGDTFDISLNADVKTLPTVGPLFGSFKLQLDIFQCPVRLYNAQLHMNKLGVGMDMSKVKFPQMEVRTKALNTGLKKPIEMQQINPSSLLSYLGVKGNGLDGTTTPPTVAPIKNYNAMPMLMYWDIYKNYYANKQEENGSYLIPDENPDLSSIKKNGTTVLLPQTLATGDDIELMLSTTDLDPLNWTFTINSVVREYTEVFEYAVTWPSTQSIAFMNVKSAFNGLSLTAITSKYDAVNKKVKVKYFPLSQIDTMRDTILKQVDGSPLKITSSTNIIPYADVLKWIPIGAYSWNEWAMNGLGLKTYQSDIFNNWLKTEWISGTGGINDITKIDTSSGSFSIDTLNLSKKVYDMLNRIAVSGGSYEDWLQAVYSHEPYRRAESPIYMGGLSKEVVFQEVVNNSASEYNNESQPLGTLAGRGTLSGKNKGGYVVVKVDEPSYIIGIISLTPRIDYSQGNDWDMELRTMNDFHKPALDQIGFQDLVTTKMAFWEDRGTADHSIKYSAGKQPAWLDYMTNFNRTYGNFANPDDQMFMTLNRRYEIDTDTYRIKDLTTYIDPQKFNYIFADTQRDAQNFWVQLAVDITARRKMSAKVIPNL